MKKTIFLILICWPSFLYPQEMESITGITKNQNIISTELSTLINEKDVFSLNAEVLEAEQGVKGFMPPEKILFNNTLLLPEVSENFGRSILKYNSDLTTLAHFGFRITGNIAGGFGPPLPSVPPSEIFIRSQQQLNDFTNQLRTDINFHFISQKDEITWQTFPYEFKSAVIKFLLACNKTESVMENFRAPLESVLRNEDSVESIFSKLKEPWKIRQMENFDVVDAMMNIDFAKLAFATRIMNENLRSLMRFIGKIENSFDRVEINTKYGLIGIFSSQKDTINKNYFTSIDFGGDDLYTNNGGSNHPLKNHVGLLIDYSGNDIYESGFINSGILGLSWLIDFSGNDKYKNSKSGVPFSLFGASFLMDMKGDDVYTTSATFSQGSAIGGVSILIDQQGNDHYFCQNYSQGFGGTLGCGILIDVSGDDEYKGAAPDENDQNRFASFIQGAAYGRWAEATDGKNLAGGFGIFVDGKGTDSYFSRSFSLGAGYYFGIGMFSDLSGNDQYNATSHSQGYAAHFALGNFCDFQGDDKYNLNSEQSKITQIMGGGRDNSCGFFADISGNDSYYFGNRSVGIGDMRGFGCFYDTNGRNEFYHVSNSINQNSLSIGKAVSIYNPASEFRLFSNRLNWNTGIYISAGINNRFYSITDSKSSVLNLGNTLQIDSNQKELEILILKK